eukprot:jgi/Undpi1/7370/HiC_scaffold_22.g09843.m1
MLGTWNVKGKNAGLGTAVSSQYTRRSQHTGCPQYKPWRSSLILAAKPLLAASPRTVRTLTLPPADATEDTDGTRRSLTGNFHSRGPVLWLGRPEGVDSGQDAGGGGGFGEGFGVCSSRGGGRLRPTKSSAARDK